MTSIGKWRVRSVVALVVIGSVSPSWAGECGELKVAGYSANRSVATPGGTMRMAVVSDGKMEREITNDGNFVIRDLRTGNASLVDLAKGTVALDSGPPGAPKAGRPETYRESSAVGGGQTQIEFGIVQNGRRLMIGRAVCRPDGIFTKREIVVPDPNGAFTITISQTDIRPGAVDPGQFKVPAGLQQVR